MVLRSTTVVVDAVGNTGLDSLQGYQPTHPPSPWPNRQSRPA